MPLSKLIRKLPAFKAMDRMEDEIHARDDVFHPVDTSPERFEIMREKIKRGGGRSPLPIRFHYDPDPHGDHQIA
jgi:hypothetical protein